MKKIGICTCYDTLNYGSMLQAFATQKTVERLGYDCEYIIYKKKKDVLFILKQIPRLLNRNLIYEKMLNLKKKKELRMYPEIKKNEEIRKRAFLKFQKKYYKKFSDINYGYDVLRKSSENYDAVMVGSDQLWSPAGLGTNFYNLMFVPNHIKKISYATSFGVNQIPCYQSKRTSKYLKRIEFLSVRELKGAEIVEKLINRKPIVVADPTLLLTKDDWMSLIEDKKIIDEPYIFCYFLGENMQHRVIAKDLSAKTKMKIVSMPFLDTFVKGDLRFGDIQIFDAGPDDFVNIIRNASYILTDSFHGSVFSILHHKQFITLNRYMDSGNSRNSRIDSLCKLLGLSTRRYSEEQNIYEQMCASIEYRMVDQKINKLRAKSLDFLSKALEA